MRDDLRRLRANRLTVVGTTLTLLIVALAVLANQVAPYDPTALNARHRLEAPSTDFRFGTDRLGRDVLSRVVHGARSSLGIAATSVTLSLLLGSTLGLFAGYFGGALDLVIGRIMDILFSFPALLLAIAVAAMLGPGVRNAALAIAVVYTPLFARVIRGPVISERHRDYVLAARVIGASHSTIIYRHILPNVVSPIIIQASAALSTAILIEAALSYIGLGTQPPAPSWGTMLSEGRTFLEMAPWMSIFPGLAIALTVLAFNLVGDGLRDAFDPNAILTLVEGNAMSNDRPFVMNRRRFVASLAGLTAAVPLLSSPGVAHAAGLLAAPASFAAETSKVFIDARTTESAGLDPHTVPALANARITHLIYEGLTWLDENLALQPLLAESWEIPDPSTYIFHIRQGVKFHNGADLTAEDVKATVERILDEATGSQFRGGLLPVAGVDIIDKYIVQFRLKTPYSGLFAVLGDVMIVPKEVKSRPIDFLKNQANGTGPWMLDSWNPNVEMQLVKNPNYWGALRTNITGITIRIMPEESSIIAALRTGDVHHAVLEDNKNYDLVKNNPSLQTWRTPALGTNVININHRKEPLSKQRVRQALSMAIDRDEILQAAGSGFGAVSGPIPASHPQWTVPIANLPFYTPDPNGAKAALAEAGYPNGFDLDIIYIPQFPLMDISAQVLAAQWQKIGINASPRATEYGVWLDLRVKTFDYWISTNLDFPTLDPDQYLFNTFHTGSSPAGWDGWSDAEIDSLLDQGRAATDQTLRQKIYTQVQQQLCDKVAAFWSYSAEHVDVASTQLLGFTPHPTTYLFGLPNASLAGRASGG